MSERWIWVVRLIGIVVFLVLMYLLMSLHARLVKMNEEQGRLTTPGGHSTATLALRAVDWDGASLDVALHEVDGVTDIGRDCTRRVSTPQSAMSSAMMRGTFRCPNFS
jgi:hypothetical protein